MTSARLDLASALREVAVARVDSFTDLARRSGLNPRTDFRNANLTGADLRHEDLRDFDFSRATFQDAKVYGAKFNGSVRRAQLKDANDRIRALVLPVGEHLEEISSSISGMLSLDFEVPTETSEAIRRTGKLRERAFEGGAFHSDNSPLIKRHLAKHLRHSTATARKTNLVVFIAQPQTDFDFDMLGVAQRAFRSAGTPVFTFVFTAALNSGSASARLVERRMVEAGQSKTDFMLIDDGGVITKRAPSSEWKDGKTFRGLVSFLNLVPTAKRVTTNSAKLATKAGADANATLLSGEVAASESLTETIRQKMSMAGVSVWRNSPRFHLLLAREKFNYPDAQKIYEHLSSNNSCDVSLFDSLDGRSNFYLVAAAPRSSIWRLLPT